jgi:hypothetical protein
VAVVERQPAIRLLVRDGSGSRSYLEFNIPAGITPSAGHAAAASMRAALAGLTGCAFYQQQVEYGLVEMTPATPGGSQPASTAGVLVFSTTEPQQYAIVVIPAIKPSLIKTTGDGAGVQLDTAAPAIVALVAELTGGAWRNKFGYTLAALDAAFVQIRP